MNLSIGLKLTAGQDAGGGDSPPPGPWNPGDEDSLALAMLPAESLAASKLWKDSGKTSLATAQNDPVFVCKDIYTGGEVVAPDNAKRPWLQFGSGKTWLAYDGTSFRNQIALTLTQPFFVWAAIRHVANNAGRVMDSQYGGDFKRALFGSSAGDWQMYAGGNVLSAAGGVVSGGDYTVGAVFNGASSKLYVGGSVALSGDPGSSGTNGTVVWCNDLSGSVASNTLIYGAAIFSGTPDDALLANLAAYFDALKP